MAMATIKGATIRGLNGLPFFLPESDDPRTLENARSITEDVWAGEYDHPELPSSHIDLVLDIGAGWGAFTVWASKRWWRHYGPICVIAYEPNPKSCHIYRENVPGADIHEVAVTVAESPRYFVDHFWSGGQTKDRAEGIPVKPMHPRELPAADLLKCDAEGVEGEVLEHYPHLPALKLLIYEFHSPELKAECRAIIARRLPGWRCLREESVKTYGTSIWVPS